MKKPLAILWKKSEFQNIIVTKTDGKEYKGKILLSGVLYNRLVLN
jgi:hypothetical protein